jgi:hypothetical protein
MKFQEWDALTTKDGKAARNDANAESLKHENPRFDVDHGFKDVFPLEDLVLGALFTSAASLLSLPVEMT